MEVVILSGKRLQYDKHKTTRVWETWERGPHEGVDMIPGSLAPLGTGCIVRGRAWSDHWVGGARGSLASGEGLA